MMSQFLFLSGEADRLTGNHAPVFMVVISPSYTTHDISEISYRTGKDQHGEFETSELIRINGDLNTSATPRRHRKGPSKGDISAENSQLAAIQKQLDSL